MVEAKQLVLNSGLLSLLAAGNFSTQCVSSIDTLTVPNGKVLSAEYVAANSTLRFPNSDPTCSRRSQTISANLCRVIAEASTSANSGIRMEVWLPQDWSGRFLSIGNSGLGGCFQYDDLEYTTSLGFAAVATNNGHDGMTGLPFLNNPDVIEDFAFRALHTSVVLGKEIIKTFYGEAHSKSYFLGCSTGGRQGWKSIQDFPGDFDGVVAGAPAFAFNNLTSWSCHFLPLTGTEGMTTFVPLDLWPVIHQDILMQCDALDGVADGILESPDLCEYDPSRLVCSPGENSSCLTSIQADTVRSILAPLYATDGSLVFPRLQPGAEATEAPFMYFNGQRFGAADWFSYAIFNNSNWDPLSLKPEDYDLASNLNLFNIETWNGNLSTFRDRGGKVLHYHGLVDGIISSDNSQRYYEHVSQTMNLGPKLLDQFYRYFRISGMAHCGRGPGASFIGNQRRSTASLNPEENVLTAIVRWVEQGIAPETITGTAYHNGSQSAGVDFKRRHCRWPYRNVYKGLGDYKDPMSWECVVDEEIV